MTRRSETLVLRWAIPGILLLLASCTHNQIDLPAYFPKAASPGLSEFHTPLVVAPLEDLRFRLYANTRSDLVSTVGWGDGTGTIETLQNIPDHISRALVSQFRAYGMNVSYAPNARCQIRGSRSHPKAVLSGQIPRHGVLLCGSILDYQFELDHPRVTLGFFSTLDMAAGATLAAQASLRLYLVRAWNGRIFWSGVSTSSQGKPDVHPPHLKRQAITYLDETLSRVLTQSAQKVSGAVRD